MENNSSIRRIKSTVIGGEDLRNKSRELEICLFFYILAVLYITLFSRPRSLMSVVHLDALWTYKLCFTRGWYYVRQILLNIALFSPLGYLVSSTAEHRNLSQKTKKQVLGNPRGRTVVQTVLLCLLFSVIIEMIQFFSGRGSLDVDDLINNSIGALVGAAGYAVIGKKLPQKPVLILLVLAGISGCTMIRPNRFDYNTQFYFDIDQVKADDVLVFSGTCASNGARTPGYSLLLRDGEGTVYQTETEISGRTFRAKAAVPEGKYEILIRFRLFPLISTETFIHGDRVEYVAGEFREPVHASGILKAYSPEYDTFVYQDGGKIVWYIGYDIEPTTEIIYHLYTNDGEQLPVSRVEYGFDNRGFKLGEGNERESIDEYRVFEKEIATEYPVTSITVGFNPGEGITWMKSFRVTEKREHRQPGFEEPAA